MEDEDNVEHAENYGPTVVNVTIPDDSISLQVDTLGVASGFAIGVSMAAVVLGVAIGVCVGHYGWTQEPSAQCVITNENQKAQIQSVMAQTQFNTKMQERLAALQMKVMDDCVTAGRVPVVAAGNNIDCKAK